MNSEPGLPGRSVVLGVSGGVAAYKSAELARLLVKEGARVRVVMTEAATHFIGAATFQAITGEPVWTDPWDVRMPNGMAHIDLTRDAQLLLIAPATADCIARLAHGRADDLLGMLCLARDATCALMVAPAMNRQMWEHPATRRNVATLAGDGVAIVGPAAGEQACGEVGQGRLVEPAQLLSAVLTHFTPKTMAGKRVLITAGPTAEPIDPVRVISNLSSGRMGYALADEAAKAGACVTLVSGPTALDTPYGVERVDVGSAQAMHEAVLRRLHECDVFISVAAVADYRPAVTSGQKIKKSADTLNIELVRNPDILADVAARADAPFCVGFAAESRDLDAYAQGKRAAKKLPLVVGNLVADGLGGADTQVVLYDAQGRHPLARAPKPAVARSILDHISKLMAD
ncbi:MAG: bifunctional phosphopantothenoylcysteine decarboxylase/phosphopantothenate--cysteine ligase CoaBC [Gammaproteobacteria bacterium]|jgi:phosphopantothenoylcysteine decarboxylase / phosphopantothenate---cysteine ligase|nr:bifunctional phosphopantothenoylcysteine decarboxylase/phosphopantothenate--cysteine ligase CoaBC [Gammaproteobacteria bacterium]MBU0771683.1 bifunctional phosphopantothenoylcysteine decarboxylase/phosphopantothenate--cysteine ligase CoaBC [Gammaproteobacteria bacterium]MBU0856956.1 bifunctional phosphopantothenoylcysteine decarboxylase/phosphopantothenate--cysteine ligase CoaBC [Gammaproteobacteria bacterium]MBU1848257.1 bifunctional phosphopantothenoylcysteine decarboxylase/phosphopantothen